MRPVGVAGLVGEVGDDRRDERRVELVADRPHDVLGHPGQGEGGDGVGLDAVAGAFDGEHARQADEAHLRRPVVGLPEVAEDAGGRRRRHDAPVLLLAHVDPRRLGDVEGALQVHVEDRVQQVGVHVVERLVAQDAGVVDHDVDAAEGVERRLHDGLAALRRGDRVGVGDRLAARRLDLVDDELGRAGIAAGAVDGAAEVVDHDQRAAPPELQGVLATEPAAGARDDRHLAVETECCHGPARYR